MLSAEEYSIQELQQIALKHNPKLRSMKSQVDMMKHRISVSTSLDDPKLKLALNNLPVNDFSLRDEDMTSKEITLSQMIPLGGKLTSKEIIAIKDYYKAIENYRKERLELLHQLRLFFYEILYLDELIKINEDAKKYLEVLIESEKAAVKSGMGGINNVIKANIERTMIEKEVIDLNQKKSELINKIKYFTGITDEINIKSFNLDEVEIAIPQKTQLKKEIMEKNADLKIALIEKELAFEEKRLREKMIYPDLEIAISYMQRENSPDKMKRSDMVSLMATVNIPLWYKSKNLNDIEEMRKKEIMMKQLIADKKNELEQRVDIILSSLERISKVYGLYKENLITQTEVVLEAALAGFRVQEKDMMGIIDTIRQYLEYKKELLLLKKDYLSLSSELKMLSGEEITN